MNKKLAILALIIGVGLTASAFATFQDSLFLDKQELPYMGAYSERLSDTKSPPPRSLSSMYGSDFQSIDSFKQASLSDVKISSSLPEGIELKQMRTKGTDQAKNRLSTIVYAPTSIQFSADATFHDVMDYHGIVVLYSEERDEFDIQQWYENVLEQRENSKQIKINDVVGVAMEGDPKQGIPSKVIFHQDRTQIELVSVAYTVDELIRIAETL